jgi:hypothetical protein
MDQHRYLTNVQEKDPFFFKGTSSCQTNRPLPLLSAQSRCVTTKKSPPTVATIQPSSNQNLSPCLSNSASMIFNDLLQEWCDARPVTILWDSNNDITFLPRLLPKKLRQTSVDVGNFTDNPPITPSKRKRGTTAQDNSHRIANAPAFLSVEFKSEAEGREFNLVWKDGGSTKPLQDSSSSRPSKRPS